jgi:hypothetical protein
MGTKTYGMNTGAGFSTFEELEYIYDEEKPFFLIKMCDKFDVDLTRFLLRKSVSYLQWLPGNSIPGDLVAKVLERLASKVANISVAG